MVHFRRNLSDSEVEAALWAHIAGMDAGKRVHLLPAFPLIQRVVVVVVVEDGQLLLAYSPFVGLFHTRFGLCKKNKYFKFNSEYVAMKNPLDF
jgi:hypothetical protein